MAMTKKDFKVFAEAIREQVQFAYRAGSLPGLRSAREWAIMIARCCRLCANRFDWDSFMAVAGIPDGDYDRRPHPSNREEMLMWAVVLNEEGAAGALADLRKGADL